MCYLGVWITSAVVLCVSIPGVLNQAPCGIVFSPVVRICYNTTRTIRRVGFATTEGLAGGVRDCSCRLTTDGAAIRLKVALVSHHNGCSKSMITLRSLSSTFRTSLTCEKPQTSRTLSVSSLNGFRQVYHRREDDQMCFRYSIVLGTGAIRMSCVVDELPKATTTTSVLTSATTAASSPVTFSSDKSSSKTASASLKTSPSNSTKNTGSATGGGTNTSTSTEMITEGTSTDRPSTPGGKSDASNKNIDGLIAAVVVSSIVFTVLI